MATPKKIGVEYGIAGTTSTFVVDNRLEGPYLTPLFAAPIRVDVLAAAIFEVCELYGMFDRSPVSSIAQPYMFGGDIGNVFLGMADRIGLGNGDQTNLTVVASIRLQGEMVIHLTPGSLWALNMLLRGCQLPIGPLVLRKVIRPDDN